jgi:hypothetical protein
VFDPRQGEHERAIQGIVAMLDTLDSPVERNRANVLESGDSLRHRLEGADVITDDNMGSEWKE